MELVEDSRHTKKTGDEHVDVVDALSIFFFGLFFLFFLRNAPLCFFAFSFVALCTFENASAHGSKLLFVLGTKQQRERRCAAGNSLQQSPPNWERRFSFLVFLQFFFKVCSVNEKGKKNHFFFSLKLAVAFIF